jgi:hypothetical protein
MENGGMKLFASVILGIVIALFVGVGINLFYPEPSYPTELMSFTNSEPTEAEAEASNLAYIEFEKERQLHSMFLAKKNEVVSQGLLVGGLLLICYGATQAISSGNMMAAFISIGVGLAALIVFILKRFRSVNGETVQS